MRPVFLAGRGLVSALGDCVPRAVETLRDGGVSPAMFEIAPGLNAPYFRIVDEPAPWADRARRFVTRAAAESGAGASRHGALFIASTSMDMGRRELGDAFDRDIPAFAEELAAWLEWQGPVLTVCTSCTSAINALLSAAAMVRSGEVDDALVLGVELVNRLTVGGFHAMQLLSPRAAQPLGEERSGLVLGEAVAALRLSATPARWIVKGGANVVDGSDPAGAVVAGVVDMCNLALAHSGLRASDIDLIKLQAAGSPANDTTELAGLHKVFEPLPKVVSSKAWLGHTLGAAGAAEIALLTACIEADVWPAPAYALDAALNVPWARSAPPRLRHVLASILGFGGGHAAVVLEDTGAWH